MKEEFTDKDKSISMQTEAEYRAYIEAHTGEELKQKNPREKINSLAMAATAYMFMKAGNTKRFNANLIHRRAEKIKQTLDFEDLHEAEIDKMIASPDSLRRGINHQLRKLYAPKDNFKDYIKNMKSLSENMMEVDNRNPKYNAMAKAIKDVAALDPEKATKDEIMVKNYRLMQNIEKNIKGRERVRRTDMGVDHFNTALDALSIMNDSNKALNAKTDAIVDSINYARGSESPNHKDHVDIKEFGVQHSAKAKAARTQRAREKKMERTLDKDKLKKKQMERPAMGR